MKKIIIKKLESIKTSDCNICVLKGIPVSIIRDLKESYSFVDNYVLDEEGRVNLEKIDMNLVTGVMAMGQEEMKLMTYESYNYLCMTFNDLKVFNKKFFILENNVVSYYENPCSIDIPDREVYVNDEMDSPLHRLLDVYYPEWINKNGVAYVAYYPHNSDFCKHVDLVDPVPFNTYELKEDGSSFLYCGKDNVEDYITELLSTGNLSSSDYVIDALDKENEKFRLFNSLAAQIGVGLRFWVREDKSQKYRDELVDCLRETWGYESFRDIKMYNDLNINRETRNVSQGEIIEHIVSQCEAAYYAKPHRDTILTASTSAGKSLLFQLSAIYMAKKYQTLTIVVSPLVSLMEDQVSNLKRRYSGVAALNSLRTPQERQEIMEGVQNNEINILYLSPELLLSYTLSTFVGSRRIGLFVVDEAHTVTTWGRDFRVDYWFLGDYVKSQKGTKYLNYKFPILALTATAVRDITRVNDMIFETIESLAMTNCKQYIGVVKRDNITFDINQVHFPGNNYQVQRTRKTAEVVKKAIEEGCKTIVYFPFKSEIENFINNGGLSSYADKIGKYHADLSAKEKRTCTEKFQSGEIMVVLATKAFGMGIDVPDIKMVYHHAPSGAISDYVQEIGRAARDTNIQGVAKLDFNEKDLSFGTKLFGLSAIRTYQLKGVMNKLMELYKMNNGKRNMLISSDDFNYLFPGNNVDYDQKLNSCLMLLSKDLQNKLNFRSLVVRPKNIFTKSFVSVPYEDVEDFVSELGEYATRIDKKHRNIFYLDCEKLWDDKFSNMNFAYFKYKLANKELGIPALENISILCKLTMMLNGDVQRTKAKLSEFFKRSESILSAMDDKRLKIEDLKKLYLSDYDEEKQDEFIETFRFVYSNGEKPFCRFYESETVREKAIQLNRCGYESVSALYMNTFESNVKGESVEKYALMEDHIFQLAQVLNSLSLGVYERVGGDNPSVFVRVNNPSYMISLTKRRYRNDILNGIYQKFEHSKELFTFFFTQQMDDKERWDFVEDYFLGLSKEELIEKYKK